MSELVQGGRLKPVCATHSQVRTLPLVKKKGHLQNAPVAQLVRAPCLYFKNICQTCLNNRIRIAFNKKVTWRSRVQASSGALHYHYMILMYNIYDVIIILKGYIYTHVYGQRNNLKTWLTGFTSFCESMITHMFCIYIYI